jgi:hypothetical protein
MAADADVLFVPDGDAYLPTDLTRGGWSPRAQHGGPPTALLAHAVEGVETPVPMEVVRLTVDLFREIPLAPITVETRVLREGRRIQSVAASLVSGDVEVARARALKIRTTHIELPPSPNPPWEPVSGPESASTFDWDDSGIAPGPRPKFHTDAIEIRTFGDSFLTAGPGRSWFRLRYPVIGGEETSPFVRMAALADMGNGNSQVLDGRDWLFVNPDLTLHLHREVAGSWLGMRSVALQHDTGVGFADTELYDQVGPIGRVAQTQLIQPREP